ncbi:MAG: VCBS repeat-containing protein [Bacteroidales bacterium]|nr:VCBS repeat-containing protein [Bacteroidales bacterium]
MNNDGEKDIVSSNRNILLHKNKGESSYTSYFLISGEPTDNIIKDMEIADIDGDGFLDILYINRYYLEILRNNHDETYSSAYLILLDNKSEDIEVADINADLKPDLLITFSEGSVVLGVMLNMGNFAFGTMSSIEYILYNFEPKRIECGDIDNDGYTDIAVCSSDVSAIQWLENDGYGNFIYHLIKSGFDTDEIFLADFNNDHLLDIVSAGNSSSSKEKIGWFRNNGSQFSDFIEIDNQSLKGLFCADINSDGYKDIIAASYEYFSPYIEELFYYLFDGNSFGNKIIISTDNAGSMTRGVFVDDLNHDNNADIVTSYYYRDKIGFFLSELPVGIPSQQLKATWVLLFILCLLTSQSFGIFTIRRLIFQFIRLQVN